jgi:hypothetical protein
MPLKDRELEETKTKRKGKVIKYRLCYVLANWVD